MRNPYEMSETELNAKIEQLRQWLFNHNGHEKHSDGLFWLELYLSASRIKDAAKRDDFVALVMKELT